MKIKYSSILKNDNDITKNEGIGTINGNLIKYKENNINVEIILEKDIVFIKRISSEFEIELKFSLKKKTEGVYYVKEVNTSMPLNINTSCLKIDDGYVNIEYSILENPGQFIFELRYEVI